MNNKSLKIIIIVLTILTIGLTGYIIYDKITEKDLSNINDNINHQIDNNVEQEDKNNNNDNNIEKDESEVNQENNESNTNDNNKEYTYKDFIRDDTLILYGVSCFGTGPLITYINNENDIIISGSGGKSLQNDGSTKENKINNIIKSANAKYLYKVGVISCDSIDLYYINNNNELYLIDNDSILYKTDISKGKKVTNSKVVEFLGEEHKEYESYIKVLLEDETVEYIKYFEVSEEFR